MRTNGLLEYQREAMNRALNRIEEELRALEEAIEQAKQNLEGLFPTSKIQWKYVRCGKDRCHCAKGGRGHGPYAYVQRKKGGKVQWTYLGKDPKLPEGAVDRNTYRAMTKQLDALRKRREKLLSTVDQALLALRMT